MLECMIDAADLPVFIKFGHRWGAFWAKTAKTNYAYCRHNNKIILMHRWLMRPPANLQVDHEDYNGLNNCRSNLSNVTRTRNQLGRRKQGNNTSGCSNVVWDKSRQLWQARAKINGKMKYLGRFESFQEASRVATAEHTRLLEVTT